MTCNECPILIKSNRIPNTGDDGCNTNGTGIFCPGSYWIYDPTLEGANTILYGSCLRVFLQSGDTCMLASWVELESARYKSVSTPPTTGVDKCPVGTIWEFLPPGIKGFSQYYISVNLEDGVWQGLGPYYVSEAKVNVNTVIPHGAETLIPLITASQITYYWPMNGAGTSREYRADANGLYRIDVAVQFSINDTGGSIGHSFVVTMKNDNNPVTTELAASQTFNTSSAPGGTGKLFYFSGSTVIGLQKNNKLSFFITFTGINGGSQTMTPETTVRITQLNTVP